MNRIALALSLAVLAITVAPAAAQDLKVGSDAPDLSIAKWVKGDAVDLSKAKPDDVYVVEFWATWCGPCLASIPHMSEMQEHFAKRGVHFVGVSNEKTSVVEKFLKNGWNEKMRYTVAMDKDEATNKAWMKAAGQGGIPTAFVVKGGKIKWIGHPANGLDIQVAELCGDKEYAEQARKIQELKKDFFAKYQEENWKDALAAAEKLLALKPKDFGTALMRYQILATKIKDTAKATKVGYAFVDRCDDAQMLNQFSWTMLTEDDYADTRDLKLALKGAKKAVELSKEKEPAILDTYARALADSGDLSGAIKWQKRAVTCCEDNDRMKGDLEDTLKGYEKKAAEGI